MTTALFLQIPE